MDKKELENLTLGEIRAMLAAGDLALQDLDTATLEKLVDSETDMLCLGEGDVDFISECAEILSERQTDIMSHEDFMAIVNKTLEKHTVPARKRFGMKRALIIAAAVATLIIGGTVVASALGFNLFDYIGKMAMSSDGTKYNEGDYTFFNQGEAREYATIKEAVEKESLNIMYPASFPEGITVKDVKVRDSYRGGNRLDVIAEDNSVSIHIETGVVLVEGAYETEDLYVHNGVGYKLHKPTSYEYGAIAYIDNCQYVIQANEYEDLIYIIENMEEYKK